MEYQYTKIESYINQYIVKTFMDSIFVEALGNSPTIRVLDFLIEGRGLDYSLTDIAENSNIGWTTLHRIWDSLLSAGFVIPTREIGRAKLFKLNVQNKSVKLIIKVHDSLVKETNEKYLNEQSEKAVVRS